MATGTLFGLPDEVLAHICRRLAESTGWASSSLSALSLTNRRLANVAQPVLLSYLDVRRDNFSGIVQRLEAMSDAQLRAHVQGVRFRDLDGKNKPDQRGAARILGLVPHIEELKLVGLEVTVMTPDLIAALRGSTHLKRFTISTDYPEEGTPPSVVSRVLSALHPNVRLDVLHITRCTSRAQYLLGPTVNVRCRSLVLDYRYPPWGFGWPHIPGERFDHQWRRFIQSQRPRAVDWELWFTHTLSELSQIGQHVRALDVTGWSSMDIKRDRPASDILPHLRVVSCFADSLAAWSFWIETPGADLFGAVEILHIYSLKSSSLKDEPARGPRPGLSFASTVGLPRLRKILTVGNCSVRVAEPASGVFYEAVDYPAPHGRPAYLRTDLLWLEETGEHRFLPE